MSCELGDVFDVVCGLHTMSRWVAFGLFRDMISAA